MVVLTEQADGQAGFRFGAAGREGPVVTTARRDLLLADLEDRLARGEGFAVATLNLDHVVKLRRDAGFRAAYMAQTHVVADGNPVVWLCRMAGQGVDLVPGSDLVAPVVAMAARNGVPVGLIGSTQAVLDLAARRLEAQTPGLRVVARVAPPMGFDPAGPGAQAVLSQVAETGARVVLLALGAPRQERLAALGRERHPGIGFLSVGAGIDFVAGAQRRAPRWVRAVAMEWLWRLAGNPRRLAARYAACAAVLPGLGLSALSHRFRR